MRHCDQEATERLKPCVPGLKNPGPGRTCPAEPSKGRSQKKWNPRLSCSEPPGPPCQAIPPRLHVASGARCASESDVPESPKNQDASRPASLARRPSCMFLESPESVIFTSAQAHEQRPDQKAVRKGFAEGRRGPLRGPAGLPPLPGKHRCGR